MPSRPDLRELASNVKEAFAEMDRETLLDILTFVVKEYVVEGPPPMLVHQAENLADLAGLSFAQLIAALQTRFDHAELSMFQVDGERVSVRVGGVLQPLLAQRQPLTGAEPAPPQAQTPPQPGVRVVETTLSPRPAAPAATPTAASAPPPVRGVSLRGRPSGDGASAGGDEPAPSANPPPAAPPAQGAAQPGAPEKPEGSGDDASARFSLLELD